MKINIYGAFKNDSDDDEPTNAITKPANDAATYNDTTATTEPSYDSCNDCNPNEWYVCFLCINFEFETEIIIFVFI